MQKDLGKLGSWAVSNHTKFSNSKYQILHLGRPNPDYIGRLRDLKLASNSVERNLGVLVDSKLNMSQ